MNISKAQQDLLNTMKDNHYLCVLYLDQPEYACAYTQHKYHLHMMDSVNLRTAKALIRSGLVRLINYRKELSKHIYVINDWEPDNER